MPAKDLPPSSHRPSPNPNQMASNDHRQHVDDVSYVCCLSCPASGRISLTELQSWTSRTTLSRWWQEGNSARKMAKFYLSVILVMVRRAPGVQRILACTTSHYAIFVINLTNTRIDYMRREQIIFAPSIPFLFYTLS